MKKKEEKYKSFLEDSIIKLFILSLIAIQLSCSEPFNFESREATIVVVDGEISTLFGESYINIYRLIDNRYKEEIHDLDVKVISDDGQIYQFRYNDDDKLYGSIDFYFVGERGTKYRMVASNNDGLIYESTYDSIPVPLTFEIIAKDTMALEFSEFGVLVDRRAVAAIATIKSTNSNFYSKFNFRYSYRNFFPSDDSIHVSDPKKYILYAEVGDEKTSKNSSVPVGMRLIEDFVFVNQHAMCDTIPLGSPDGSDPCVLPCCNIEEFWKVKFEISAESMTKQAYEFWENTQKLTKNDGLIFDTYPFPIKSNVTCTNCENDVVGNFRAISKSYSSTIWAE